MVKKGAIETHQAGRIDIHNREAAYNRAMSQFATSQQVHEENRELILRFLRDCQLGKTIKGRSKKRIGVARCLKYLAILGRLDEWFSKPFGDVTMTDMEVLVGDLEGDKIRRRNGERYSAATKCDWKKTIKKFWKWKDGNSRHYPELVEWIETLDPVTEVPALSYEEVEELVSRTPSIRNKALILVLFDSGARIEELLNVRLKDDHIAWQPKYRCYQLRIEFSKTLPRTVTLPLCTRWLRKWLESHPGKGNDQAQLFPIRYDNARTMLTRLAKSVLGKRVTPHVLRHSSATYYAPKLNRYHMCYRYGWAMSSKVVDRYIDRSGFVDGEAISGAELKQSRDSLDFGESASRMTEGRHSKETRDREVSAIWAMMKAIVDSQRSMASALSKISGKPFDIRLPGQSPEVLEEKEKKIVRPSGGN